MITPVGFSINSPYQNKNRNVNFKARTINNVYYTDKEEKLAKLFLNAVNFDTPVRDAFWEDLSAWSRMWGDYIEDTEYALKKVKDLIAELKKEAAQKAKELAQHKEEVRAKRQSVEDLLKSQEVIHFSLLRQQILNVREELKLASLKQEEGKRKHIQETLFNNLILPLQAEKNMQTGEKSVKLNRLNGVMFDRFEDDEYKKTIDWLREEIAPSEIVQLDFAQLSQREALKKLSEVFKASTKGKNRTFLQIDNLERHTELCLLNKLIIGKLKTIFQKCSDQYKCIILANIKNPEIMEPEMLAPQRFGVKINLDKFKDTSGVAFESIQDGRRMALAFPERSINLYRGNCGYDESILWVDSTDPKDVMSVLVHLDDIRGCEEFRNVVKIQHPVNIKDEVPHCFKELAIKTANNQPIRELNLETLGLL